MALGWHAIVYLTLSFGAAIEIPIYGSNDETHRPQAIVDIYEDSPVLHKLQQGTFPLSTLAMEKGIICYFDCRQRWNKADFT